MITKRVCNIFSIIFLVIGILTGVLAIYVGISIITGFMPWYAQNNIRFGADFYTEIYSVVESLRGHLVSIRCHILEGFCWLFIILGFADVGAFGFVLMKNIEKNHSSNTKKEPIVETKESDATVTE